MSFVVALALASTPSHAQEPTPVEEPAPTPRWRFKQADKPVKVVVLAGSIGAFPKQPYAKEIARLCKNVEVHNLSKVGEGAWGLERRFRDQVLENPHLRLRDEAQEHWLLYGGGLNSVGTPHSTNKHMRDLFVMAHEHGFEVVALSLTPWGDVADKRWRGHKGLEYKRVTQAVVDYTMKRTTPEQALAGYARKRPGGSAAAWEPRELPDVAVDLYDSPLRDRDATPLDLDAARESLARDKTWKQLHAKLDDAARAARLEQDAKAAAELPKWFMRKELRSFDHIHPNAEGHRLMAAVACPSLPASWGCTCEPIETK
ncbi:MAG TPA: SGNH/GDSL hydrolase family protein [Nannocystaceae bacterium]|nr:SGNH/GDSL hydrolase family protein [Nannocystaceae bacterium]